MRLDPRRRALLGLAGAVCVAGLPLARVHAQVGRLRPQIDYEVIPAQPVATGARIEVVEFFWYRCPHCNNLQPSLEGWLKRKPADVHLRRIPAIFSERWVPHAQLYYTLEALGEVERLHQAVYRALHSDGERLATGADTQAWAVRHGVEGTRWVMAYNSPEVERRVHEAVALTRAYRIEGTPSLVVDGRYLTSTGMAESMAEVITILEGLIALARERRAASR